MNGTEQRRLRRFRAEALQRQGGRCFWCDAGLDAESATADHVSPRAFGGRTTPDNIVAACWPCNHRRGRRTDRKLCLQRGASAEAACQLASGDAGKGGRA